MFKNILSGFFVITGLASCIIPVPNQLYYDNIPHKNKSYHHRKSKPIHYNDSHHIHKDDEVIIFDKPAIDLERNSRLNNKMSKNIK